MAKQPTFIGPINLLAWRLLEFYGIDPGECFNPADLDRERLEDPETRIELTHAEAIWRCVQTVITDPCCGLNAANFWHPSTFGVLGYAMMASSTLRTSLERMIRYQRLVVGDSNVTLTETTDGMRLRQENYRHQSGELPILVDVGLSIWLHVCRFNYGDILDPVEVRLMREKPECAGRYYAFFRCPVHFNAAENSLILPGECMDTPLPSRNRELATMHDLVLQNYLRQLQQGALSAKVREAIVDLMPSGNINKESVAESLHMSSRTLHRRLQEEDTSFAEILNETRRELAIQYIQDDSLSLLEISYLLGFSDSSAFSRAFKRWTGKSPIESRAKT